MKKLFIQYVALFLGTYTGFTIISSIEVFRGSEVDLELAMLIGLPFCLGFALCLIVIGIFSKRYQKWSLLNLFFVSLSSMVLTLPASFIMSLLLPSYYQDLTLMISEIILYFVFFFLLMEIILSKGNYFEK